MRSVVVVLMLCSFIFAQGCCSIFCSKNQNVSINSKPEGADVKVGPYKGAAPFHTSIPRGKEYVIETTYHGKTQTQALERSIEPLYWVNILFWPGLLVDLGTGKMWKYNPDTYEVSFQ